VPGSPAPHDVANSSFVGVDELQLGNSLGIEGAVEVAASNASPADVVASLISSLRRSDAPPAPRLLRSSSAREIVLSDIDLLLSMNLFDRRIDHLWDVSIADNDKYDVLDAQPDLQILDAIFADLDDLLPDVE
jgi:hypothetical protein